MSEIKNPADQIAEQTKKIAEQDKKIEALNALLASAKPIDVVAKAPVLPGIPKSPVKVGEKSFRWNVAAFQMPGSSEKITAEEAGTDADLLATIVAIEGQGLLTELV